MATSINQMHRIPHGNNKPDKNKPVIFLMHGLLVLSVVWVLMGPGSGLSYILAEKGYDVWMCNARGNTYSRGHTHLRSDAILNTDYWQFSWDEIGHQDLPTMIGNALDYTGKQSLHYIGHSQGTTSFFVMGSLRPEYNDNIIRMHTLAPVAYMANNRMPLLLFISPFANNIETMLPTIFGHCRAGAAVRQLVHYVPGISGKEFRRYNYGSCLAKRRAYGTRNPPLYDVSKITAPVFLHYSNNDQFAHAKDVDTLFSNLGRPIGKFQEPLATFAHVDFMWAIDVKVLLYNRVINLLSAMDTNTIDDINIEYF